MFPPERFPAIRIARAAPRGLLLYDGGCGFCSRSVRMLERLARRPFDKRPSADVLSQLPADVAATVAGQMLWLDTDGSIWGGSEALTRALSATGWSWPAWLIGNPIVRPFTRAGYRLIARLRHRLAPRVCEVRPGAARSDGK